MFAADDSDLDVDEEIRQLTNFKGNQREKTCGALRRKDLLDYFRDVQWKCKRHESGDDNNCCSSCKDVANEPECKKPISSRTTTRKLRHSTAIIESPVNEDVSCIPCLNSPIISTGKPKPISSSYCFKEITCDGPQVGKESCSKQQNLNSLYHSNHNKIVHNIRDQTIPCDPCESETSNYSYPSSHIELSCHKSPRKRSPKCSGISQRSSVKEKLCPCCGCDTHSKVHKYHTRRDTVKCPDVTKVTNLETIWNDTYKGQSSRTLSPKSSCCVSIDESKYPENRTPKSPQISCCDCLIESSSADLKSINVEVIESSSDENAYVKCVSASCRKPCTTFPEPYENYRTDSRIPKDYQMNNDVCSNSSASSTCEHIGTQSCCDCGPHSLCYCKPVSVPCRAQADICTIDEDDCSPPCETGFFNNREKFSMSYCSMEGSQDLPGDDDLNSLEILCCEEILENKAKKAIGQSGYCCTDEDREIKQLFPSKLKKRSKICGPSSRKSYISCACGNKKSSRNRHENAFDRNPVSNNTKSPQRLRCKCCSPSKPSKKIPCRTKNCQVNGIDEGRCCPESSERKRSALKYGLRNGTPSCSQYIENISTPDVRFNNNEVKCNNIAMSQRYKNYCASNCANKECQVCETQNDCVKKNQNSCCCCAEESKANSCDGCECCKCPTKDSPEDCSCSACWETSDFDRGCECCKCPESGKNERTRRTDPPIILSASQYKKFRERCARIRESMDDNVEKIFSCSKPIVDISSCRNKDDTCLPVIDHTNECSCPTQDTEQTSRIAKVDPCTCVESYPKDCIRLDDISPDIPPANNWTKCGQRIRKVTEEYKKLTSCVKTLQREAQDSSPQRCVRKTVTRRYPTGKEFTFEVKQLSDNVTKSRRSPCVLPQRDLRPKCCDCEEPPHEVPVCFNDPIPCPSFKTTKTQCKNVCSNLTRRQSPLCLCESNGISRDIDPSSSCIPKVCPSIYNKRCKLKRIDPCTTVTQCESDPIQTLESFCDKVKAIKIDCPGPIRSTKYSDSKSSIGCTKPMSIECPCSLCQCRKCPCTAGHKTALPTTRCTARHSRMIKRNRPKPRCTSAQTLLPCPCKKVKRKKSKPKIRKLLIFPPDGDDGPPLTLYKNSSNVNCRVKGDAHAGFCYNVTYTQRFVSSTWCPEGETRSRPLGLKYDSKKCQCSMDYG